MFSAPAPKNTNTPAVERRDPRPHPGAPHHDAQQRGRREVQHDDEQLVRHVAADPEHPPQQRGTRGSAASSSAGSAGGRGRRGCRRCAPARKSQSSAQNHHLLPHESSSGIAASSHRDERDHSATRASPSRRNHPTRVTAAYVALRAERVVEPASVLAFDQRLGGAGLVPPALAVAHPHARPCARSCSRPCSSARRSSCASARGRRSDCRRAAARRAR